MFCKLLLLLLVISVVHGFSSSRVVPYNMGVNIHFTSATPEQWKVFQETNLKWIRIDFFWNQIETQKGVYDFSVYDNLFQQILANNIRPIFILDYMNPFYDNNQSPYTDEGRLAFARYAVAAVQRYAGHNIIWEIYNEPNVPFFWHPKPNSYDYSLLVQTVATAIRQVAPTEVIMAPALSTLSNEAFIFIEDCFKNNILNYIDAVSVHPYRPQFPETVSLDYQRLRKLILQ